MSCHVGSMKVGAWQRRRSPERTKDGLRARMVCSGVVVHMPCDDIFIPCQPYTALPTQFHDLALLTQVSVRPAHHARAARRVAEAARGSTAVRLHPGCLGTKTSWRAPPFWFVMRPSSLNHLFPSFPSSQSTYRAASHIAWLTEHLHRPIRKRVFDVNMLEQLGTLLFMTEMDDVVIGASSEAAGGRRDPREITSSTSIS